MEYYNDDSLIRYFHDEIERVSSRKIAALQKEISSKKQEELAKLSLEVKHQVDLSLGVELKDMKDKYRQDINDLLSKNAHILYVRRKEISEDIFNEIHKKLLLFVKSKKYEDFIETKLKTIESQMTSQNLSFYIRPNDEVCNKMILTFFDKSINIVKDDKIKIGGFRVVSSKLMLEIDETLDTKLENNKTWFYTNSKLFIKN
jgi:vacuolar-type H+-ATPase subunit E/Vma4